MSVLKEQMEAAEIEAKLVDEEMKRQFEEVRKKYEGEQGLDKGAREIKAITQEGMRKIAEIREKYGIPHPAQDK